jgi:hypothetical protein
MANSDEEYQSKLKSFIHDVFTKALKGSAKEMFDSSRKTIVIKPERAYDQESVSREFKPEVYFIAFRCQVHYHPATCKVLR